MGYDSESKGCRIYWTDSRTIGVERDLIFEDRPINGELILPDPAIAKDRPHQPQPNQQPELTPSLEPEEADPPPELTSAEPSRAPSRAPSLLSNHRSSRNPQPLHEAGSASHPHMFAVFSQAKVTAEPLEADPSCRKVFSFQLGRLLAIASPPLMPHPYPYPKSLSTITLPLSKR